MGKVWKRRWLLKHSAAAQRREADAVAVVAPEPVKEVMNVPEELPVHHVSQAVPKKAPRKSVKKNVK
jgi:hypothetical protein